MSIHPIIETQNAISCISTDIEHTVLSGEIRIESCIAVRIVGVRSGFQNHREFEFIIKTRLNANGDIVSGVKVCKQYITAVVDGAYCGLGGLFLRN